MDIGYDGILVRSLDSLNDLSTFASVTTVPYAGYDYDPAGYPYPLVLHFDGDLTDAEVQDVYRILQTTPEQQADQQVLRDLETDLSDLITSGTTLQVAGLNVAVKRLAEAILALDRLERSQYGQ